MRSMELARQYKEFGIEYRDEKTMESKEKESIREDSRWLAGKQIIVGY